jgi:hypothetical protein
MMNERIKEIMIEHNIHVDFKDSEYVFEKFAELIVRECMRMCEVTEMSFVTHDCDVEASGAITVKYFIAEHFGMI